MISEELGIASSSPEARSGSSMSTHNKHLHIAMFRVFHCQWAHVLYNVVAVKDTTRTDSTTYDGLRHGSGLAPFQKYFIKLAAT